MSSELIVTVTADPPWPWDDRLRMQPTKRGSEDQYGKMTIQEIKDLYTASKVLGRGETISPSGRVSKIADVVRPAQLAGHRLADVGFCNLWTTATHILNGNAMDVMRHWGYEPKQIVPWIKGEGTKYMAGIEARGGIKLDMLGMGWIFRSCSEFLIVGTRGKYKDLVKRHDRAGLILDDLILVPRPPKRAGTTHSRKPLIVYQMIEDVMPGPYLELFPGDDTPAYWQRWGRPRPEIVHPDTPIEWP